MCVLCIPGADARRLRRTGGLLQGPTGGSRVVFPTKATRLPGTARASPDLLTAGFSPNLKRKLFLLYPFVYFAEYLLDKTPRQTTRARILMT